METPKYKRGVVRKGRYSPIHTTVMRAKLPDGTVRLGWFADDDTAREQCAERKVTEGSRWKIEPKQVRNSGFWRLAHTLGTWLVKHHEDFEGLDGHEALKELQRRSGIGCVVTRSDIRDNDGVLLYRVASYQPLSLAYDCMDESEFRTLWHGERGNGGWMGWMRRRLYPNLPDMTVTEIEKLIVGRVVDWDEYAKQK